MSASPVSAESAAPVTKPLPPESDKPASASRGSVGWKKYVTPLLVVVLAVAVLITIKLECVGGRQGRTGN